MATITCNEATTLINEVSPLGCKSPWEVELAKLALLNRISDYMQGGGATRGVVRSVTVSEAVLSTDYCILADASSGAITLTLPSVAISNSRIYVFKRINSGVNSVIVDGYASETIDGNLTHTLTPQWNSLTIICNGVAWFIISDH